MSNKNNYWMRRMALSCLVCMAGGLLCAGAVFEAHGPGDEKVQGLAEIVPGASGLAWALFFERLLQGICIGAAGSLPLFPPLRGALIGFLFSFSWGMFFLIEAGIYLAAFHIFFGVLYGIFADGLASWHSRERAKTIRYPYHV